MPTKLQKVFLIPFPPSFLTDASDRTCERERDFRIRHFAGDVVYDTTGFVEKNNDTLFHDLKRFLYNCNNDAMKTMWPEGADPLTEVHKMPYTAATNFRHSMDALVTMLKVSVNGQPRKVMLFN